MAVLPVVVGLGRDAATARLEAAGLVVGATSERDGPSGVGVVVAVEPAEGRLLPRGTVVALVLASGRTTLPDLVGTPLEEALAALSRVGLAASWIRVPSADERVLTMTPGPGSSVAHRSTVALVVGAPVPHPPAPTTSGTVEAPTGAPTPEVSSPPPSAPVSPSSSPSTPTPPTPEAGPR
jgi:serine/threonine-protein kinase